MKKILFVIDTIDIGGATKLTFDLINEIDKDKYDVRIMYLNEAKFKGENLIDYFNFKDISEYVSYENLKSLKRLIYFYKEFRKYDLVHSCMEQSNFYTSLTKYLPDSDFKLVITYHGLDSVYTNDNSKIKIKQSASYKFVMKYIQNIIYGKVDKFISVCEDLKRYLVESRKISPDKIEVIYHGLNINYAESISKDKINERPDPLHFTVGYLGRLGYSKGLEGFIDIVKDLKIKIPRLKVAFKGDGELREYLNSYIAEKKMEDYCYIEDFDKNVFKFYKKLNLFVLPSFYETTNLTLLEAMYSGTTVLASNTGGIPEIIEDKKNGFLFECGNFSDMSDKIKMISQIDEEELEKIREEALKTVNEKFNFNKNISKIESEFNTLLKNI